MPIHSTVEQAAAATATAGTVAGTDAGTDAGTTARRRAPAKAPSRRHLWDLPANAHCPVIGLCLPLSLLRRLVSKALGGKALADDYELHVGAVAECRGKSRVSVLLEDALDQRYCVQLHRFRSAHSEGDVLRLWTAARGSDELAGALWAALTHPASGPEQQEALLREVHMLHHHACAAPRGAGAQAAQLKQALAGELRQAQLAAERSGELAQAHTLLAQARAALAGRDALIASLRSQLAAAAVPDLDTRVRLARKLALAEARERALALQLAALRSESAPAPAPDPVATSPAVPDAPPPRLDDKTVLCVGGRSRSVSSYRGMTEQTGAQFAHHDGGLEDSAALLDASLAAADLVICQTGCISHNAYWRVKDHCKRTGKQCVFVDNPSASGFYAGLRRIAVTVG